MPKIVETINKVHSFSELENGWHFGEGKAPSARMRNKAIDLLHEARTLGMSRSNAFPGINGEIQITFYHRDYVLELTLETDGSITIAEDKGTEQIFFEEGLSVVDAFAKMEEFSQKLWETSESFIEGTMIRNASVSLVPHSNAQVMAESQFSTSPVLWGQVERSASTLEGFTQIKLATPQSIGKYWLIYNPQTAEWRARKAVLETNAIATFSTGAKAEREKHSRH